MSYFSEFCDEASISNISVDQCQKYIDQPHSSDECDLFGPSMSEDSMTELIKTMKKDSAIASDKAVLLGDMKRITALALSTLVNSSTTDGTIQASRVLLSIISLPSASAYGLSNSNIYNTVLTNMLKIITTQLKTTTTVKKSNKTRKTKSQNDSESEGDEEEDDIVETGDQFQITLANAEDKDEDLLSSQRSRGGAKRGNSQSTASNSSDGSQVDVSLIKLFIMEISANIGVFARLTDEHLINTAADLLVALLYFTTLNLQLNKGLIAQMTQGVVSFGVQSQASLMSVYRALMPVLTLASRNLMLPDVQKIKNSAHKAALNVLNQLIKESTTSTVLQNSALSTEESDTTTTTEVRLLPASATNGDEEVDEQESAMDVVTPDKNNAKGKAAALLTKKSTKANSRLSSASAASRGDDSDEDDNDVDDEGAKHGRTKKKSEKKKRSGHGDALSLPYKCIIGMLQRMTVSSPDRAPIRALILQSVTEVLTVIDSLSSNGSSSVQVTAGAVDANVKALNHYISFLSTLSKSSKVSHRAFSLDIATAVLNTDWVWLLPESIAITTTRESTSSVHTSAENSGADDASGANLLLNMLIARCNDSAPSVRMRSLNSIHDLLANLSDASTPEVVSLLYALVTDKAGASSHSGNQQQKQQNEENTEFSLLDMLRIRCDDEKPLVRAKALQCLSKALTMEWPSKGGGSKAASTDLMDTSSNPELAAMFPPLESLSASAAAAVNASVSSTSLTEEDICVFIDHCSDASLSARKQALACLTELLESRPSDVRLQDAWLQAALPLTFDSESTVVSKLCGAVCGLFLESMVRWYEGVKNGDNGPSPDGGLVWRLCLKISSLGLFRILKSAVHLLVKQGHLRGYTLSNSQLNSDNIDTKAGSLKYVMEILKFACCYHLNEDNSAVAGGVDVTVNRADISVLNALDAVDVSKAAWVFLEAVVSQENVSILMTTASANSNSIQQTGSNANSSTKNSENVTLTLPIQDFIQSTGSADFVVRCYKDKHSHNHNHSSGASDGGNSAGLIFDLDDLRILKVIEKVACNLSAADTQYLARDLVHFLCELQSIQDTQLVASAVAVKVQLSKNKALFALKAKSVTEKNKAEFKQLFYSDIQQWSSRVMSVCEAVLQAFIFHSTDASASELIGGYGVDASMLNTTSAAIANTAISAVSPALQQLLDSYLKPASRAAANNSYSFADQVAAGGEMEEVVKQLVNVALFVIGEISMIGFTVEEDEALINKKNTFTASTATSTATALGDVGSTSPPMLPCAYCESNDMYKLVLPERVVTLVKILMGHSLPAIGSTGGNFRGNESAKMVDDSMVLQNLTTNTITTAVTADNSSGGGGARKNAVKIRANAFVTLGKICLRDKNTARDHVNIFLREISLQGSTSQDSVSVAGQMGVDSNGTEFSLLFGSNNNNETMNNTHHNSMRTSMGGASSVNNSRLTPQQLQLQNAPIRCNALLALGDLCIRYTHLVDRHIDKMSYCLQDTDIGVRRNALILLTQLLLQDYLKWKGFLLYRFLTLICDDNYEIAEFTKNLLSKTLNSKFPNIVSNHFCETIVVLNGCTDHSIYTAIANTNIGSGSEFDGAAMVESGASSSEEKGDDVIAMNTTGSALIGQPLSRAQRFEIYSFMAENLSDEMKIQITAKIVQDLLAAAVDSTTMLPNRSKASAVGKETTPFEHVLEDVFMILRSNLLKVGSKKASTVDEGDNDLEELAAAGGGEPNGDEGGLTQGAAAGSKNALAQAKSKVLKKLSSQHLVSHILPVVMSLKHCLQTTKSPLQGSLMEYLVVLCKHHKNEVEQVLQFDPTLKDEIEYDLKQFERNKANAAALAAAEQLAVAAALRARASSIGSASGSTATATATATDNLSLLSSAVKLSVRKSLGGMDSGARRTPSEAMLISSGVKSIHQLSVNSLHPLSAVKARIERSAMKTPLSAGGRKVTYEPTSDVDRLVSSVSAGVNDDNIADTASTSANVGASRSGADVGAFLHEPMSSAKKLLHRQEVEEEDDEDEQQIKSLLRSMKKDIQIATLMSSGQKVPQSLLEQEDNDEDDSDQENDSDKDASNPAKALFQEPAFRGGGGGGDVRRRSWSVTVSGLNADTDDDDDDGDDSDRKNKPSSTSTTGASKATIATAGKKKKDATAKTTTRKRGAASAKATETPINEDDDDDTEKDEKEVAPPAKKKAKGNTGKATTATRSATAPAVLYSVPVATTVSQPVAGGKSQRSRLSGGASDAIALDSLLQAVTNTSRAASTGSSDLTLTFSTAPVGSTNSSGSAGGGSNDDTKRTAAAVGGRGRGGGRGSGRGGGRRGTSKVVVGAGDENLGGFV